MKLDYASLLSPNPIPLSFGDKGKRIHLRKPTLNQIDTEITLQQFGIYELFLKMTPFEYYTKLLKDTGGEDFWSSLDNDSKNDLTMYDLIIKDDGLRDMYEKIFSFFFVEKLVYQDKIFIFIPQDKEYDNATFDDVCGIITKDNFNEFLWLIQQTCCMASDKKNETVKFKNNLARKLYEKMQKAESKKDKPLDKDLSLANIISKVSNHHPTVSPITVWDMTIFQLIDAFNCLQGNERYEINKVRVSVWGDEKNTFDDKLWYKNNYETN